MRSYLGVAILPLSVAISGPALGHEVKEGTIKIEHPRAAPTPAGAKTGAAYMEIVNNGKAPVEIKSLSTPIAEAVEVHTVTMTGEIMRMRPVELPISIAPGESLKLSKDRHIMLIGLKKPLVEEDMVPFKVEFANGKTMEFDLYIEGDAEDHDAH
ncbi:MAG: copper chaperone PCu(A)C [Alphaproteobacteria bacterium]|nr:copper chaperone PCu(A)C [Alphaproteobacteria bacterium]